MAIKMKPGSSWKCQRGCVKHQVILAILTLLPADVQSRIAYSQHHLVVQEGENVVFDQCPSPPDSDGHWGYKRSLETRDYSECWGKCSTCSSRVLIISDVIRSCGGYYQYNTSPDSNGTRWRCDLQLDVYYPPSPIHIDNPPPQVFEGDDVTMTCSTDDVGNPPGNFTGRQFPKTAGTQNSTSLRLQATRERDGEVIVCEFQYRRFNQTRSNTTTALLTVFYLPENVSIKEQDSITTFNVGDNVTLQCIMGSSNPDVPTISWWKNDVILRGETFRIFSKNSVSVQDSGTYKCKATIQALGQQKSKESKGVYISVTSPGPTHGTPSSNTGTIALLTTIDLIIIGGAAFVVMVIILVVTALFCFWKRRESRDRAQALQANGSFHLVPSRPTDDVMAPGSDRGNLDGEEFEPQPPPYSRVNPDPRFPTTQTCPWADGACHLPLVTHYQSPGTTLTLNEETNNGTIPSAAASVPSVTEGTRPKVSGECPRSVEDSSIPDKPGSLRSHPELHVPRPLPANLTISDMISEGS